MSNLKKKRVKAKEQDPIERGKNFKEVSLGYGEEEAIEEANRCLGCKNPKCVEGCPVSVNIPSFISFIKKGDFSTSFEELSKYNALPAVCGRVCPQESQCEGKCVLGIKGEPLAIGQLERFIADFARNNKLSSLKKSEKILEKVAVIGSGPAGLTCAGELAKLGYRVTIFEALHESGGVLVYGIPEFRLPKKDVVKYEIEEIKKLGVKIENNVVVGKTVDIEEAARTSLRLGAETHIIYRRSEKELPARLEEIHHAKEEGVILDVLTNPTEILTDEKGWVKGIKCIRMKLGEEDSSGRRRPIEIENSEFIMEVDSVIMSLGTSPNPLISNATKGLKTNKRGCLLVDEESLKTSLKGIYAGGDAVTGAATVILAMGAGKKAAKSIDSYLRKEE